MTPWISARRAEAFESELSSPSTGGAATDDQALLDLVHQLRAVESPAPRPEFMADLRERLMSEAADVLVAVPAGERPAALTLDRLTLPQRDPRRQRRLVAAIGTVVLVGTGSTMAMAAQSALPGEGLYPIKRLVENARSSVTFSDTGRAEQDLDHARARLDEAAALVRKGDKASLNRVPEALGTFVAQSREGADTLLAEFATSERTSSVEAVRSFAAESLKVLRTMQPGTPTEASQALRDAASAMVQLDSSASALCPTCAGGLGDYSGLLAAAPVTSPVVPPLDTPTLSPSQPALPTIDPSAVAKALAEKPSLAPTTRPDPTVTRSPKPTTKPTDDTTKPTTPTTPTVQPTNKKDPITGLTDGLLGNGKTGDDATPGVVPGVVGGVVGVVTGLLGTLTGQIPPPKP